MQLSADLHSEQDQSMPGVWVFSCMTPSQGLVNTTILWTTWNNIHISQSDQFRGSMYSIHIILHLYLMNKIFNYFNTLSATIHTSQVCVSLLSSHFPNIYSPLFVLVYVWERNRPEDGSVCSVFNCQYLLCSPASFSPWSQVWYPQREGDSSWQVGVFLVTYNAVSNALYLW